MKHYKLDQYFEFTFQTQRFDTGAATDADALPTWRVYEENADAVIASGNCAKRDDDNTAGYYYARGQITAAAGYEVGKTYEVRAAAAVNSVSGAAVVGRFAVLPANVWDALYGGTDKLDVNAAEVGGTGQTGHDVGASVNTMVGRLLGTIAAGTHQPQSGDAYGRIGAAGAGLTALGDARLAYLDAAISDVPTLAELTALIQGITQAQRVRVLPAPMMERPDSESTPYRIWIYAYDAEHKAEDLDSVPTVTAENNAGTDRSANLGTVTKPGGTTGQYYVDYTVASDHAIEGLVFKVNATEGGVTTGYAAPSIVVDTTAVDFTAADRSKLETLATDYTTARAAKLDNLDATVSSRATGTVAGNILDAVTHVTYGNQAIATAINSLPSADDIKTALEADGGKLDHLWEMTEDDAGVRRLTQNALEQAPSGSGATAEEVWTHADRQLTSDGNIAVADATLTRDLKSITTTVTYCLYTYIMAALKSAVSGTSWLIQKPSGAEHKTGTVTTDVNGNITGADLGDES